MNYYLSFHANLIEKSCTVEKQKFACFFNWIPFFEYDFVGISVVPLVETSQSWNIKTEITCDTAYSSNHSTKRLHLKSEIVEFYSDSLENGSRDHKLLDLDTIEEGDKKGKHSDILYFKLRITIIEVNNLPDMKYFDPYVNHADIILEVDGISLYANKSSLCYHSPVFKEMIDKACKRKISNIFSGGIKTIQLKYEDASSILHFLRALYEWDYELSEKNIREILHCAIRFQTRTVIERCEQFILHKLQEEANNERASGRRVFATDETIYRDILKNWFLTNLFTGERAGNYSKVECLIEIICFVGSVSMMHLLEKCAKVLETEDEWNLLERSASYLKLSNSIQDFCKISFHKNTNRGLTPFSVIYLDSKKRL